MDNLMVVNVIDNGEGVPDSIRDHLFEPFVSEGKQKGTGLGLTLVQCIAIDHGGDVRVLHTCVGETVFQMTLARDLSITSSSYASDIAQKPVEVDESVQA
jgi:nitrogen-specific signal transduction histidine kinase